MQGEENSHLSGYLSAANAVGCLSGALLGVFVLVPLGGSEISLKALVGLLAVFWALFLMREPLPPKRLATAAGAAAMLLAVLFVGSWNWGTLTSGLGNFFGQGPVHSVEPSEAAHQQAQWNGDGGGPQERLPNAPPTHEDVAEQVVLRPQALECSDDTKRLGQLRTAAVCPIP
ncbi:MAG: hypothetical protein WDO73_28910 [Ignavibacteriota bacterium]